MMKDFRLQPEEVITWLRCLSEEQSPEFDYESKAWRDNKKNV
jgi:hypothetical protein